MSLTLLQLYVFVLAGFVGFLVITRVPPLLHTPLMSATSEPTRLMAEIAFVADMSGVCRSGGTRVITRKPTKPASTNT